ncbi:MAG: fructose-6-phosphate aldolase [Firmicutes bacterium HGW-Firmicutes-1]|jgi:fructose-6-phosphate aldolase 2|nr:MAG: fructose-6-phosphate aldolase [Firmicutes bacterium HGW-Firmicutes-1]
MLYLLDTANLSEIRKAYDLYPMDGVTTNPTIIAKEQVKFIDHLKEIRSIIGTESMLHVQVLGSTAETMIEEALYLQEQLGGNLYIKIPATTQGIKAMKTLNKKGFKLTATAIFTAQQALMAAKAGADFVAPYVNRIDNISGSGVSVVEDIVHLFNTFGIDTKVLAASFKNVQLVHNSLLVGAHSITVNMETFDMLIEHPLTDWSVDQFVKDWEQVYGRGKTVLDII